MWSSENGNLSELPPYQFKLEIIFIFSHDKQITREIYWTEYVCFLNLLITNLISEEVITATKILVLLKIVFYNIKASLIEKNCFVYETHLPKDN